jgi:thiamine pyrophosphate-dependent acetolactate synthase large subunit-like protein
MVNLATNKTYTLNRRKVVARLLEQRDSEENRDLLIITGLGSPTYDVHAVGDNDRNYYLWGAMGSASLVGFGLALSRPENRVLVITGDGEQLMGLGGLATIAVQNPANLSIVVLDNGHFGETGMQKSHTHHGVDLVGVARSCGIAQAREFGDMEGVENLASSLFVSEGTSFTSIRIKPDNHERSIPAVDGTYLKNRMRRELGFSPL